MGYTHYLTAVAVENHDKLNTLFKLLLGCTFNKEGEDLRMIAVDGENHPKFNGVFHEYTMLDKGIGLFDGTGNGFNRFTKTARKDYDIPVAITYAVAKYCFGSERGADCDELFDVSGEDIFYSSITKYISEQVQQEEYITDLDRAWAIISEFIDNGIEEMSLEEKKKVVRDKLGDHSDDDLIEMLGGKSECIDQILEGLTEDDMNEFIY